MRALLLLFPLIVVSTCLRAQSGSNERLARQLQRLLVENEQLAGAAVGLSVYDLEEERERYGYRSDDYFVPASNMKLLTVYLARRQLGDRAAAICHREYDNRYELWGTGYPLFRHPAFGAYDALSPWVTTREKPLIFNLGATPVPRYGAGWSWDDYPYGYVFERSALPLFGNRLYLETREGKLVGTPGTVTRSIDFRGARTAGAGQNSVTERPRIQRAERGNDFTVIGDLLGQGRFPVQRPLALNEPLTVDLLREAAASPDVYLGHRPSPPIDSLTCPEAPLPDTIFREILTNSDNWLAEQLLLQIAFDRYGTFDEERAFEYGTDTLLAELGPFEWADASGLTRYNLLQPRQLVRVLSLLDREVGRERLKDWLATGGRTGTLERRFQGANPPYVWAKTGSLSGVIAISGFLETKRGRTLAFSLLVNNYVGSTGAANREVERVLRFLRDRL